MKPTKKKLVISKLTEDERNNFFNEYMHKIGQWKTIDWKVTIVWPYMKWTDTIDGFRDFLKNYPVN
jgi:hypothetical protein